jgi:CheY-like chemotaxis protein
VRADVTQLHQVLMNLCINARDAMPEGGRLTLSAANRTADEALAQRGGEGGRPGRYVALAVEDTGTGIAPEVLGRIFEPFFTTKEPGKGTGLGLSTTRAIAQAHGGFVLVDSEPGRGSCFEVFLPAADRAAPAEAAPAAPAPEGRGELVLVADDEASIREITRTTLEVSGYRVLTAQDGAEAVALYAEHAAQVRAVLVDMVMPVMDGPAAIEALLRLNPALRVLAVSGTEGDERARQACRAARAHLAKPFTAETLLTTLRQVLDAPT